MKPKKKNISVLIVDDDVSLRKLERMLLERAGYQVQEAADGASALDILNSRRIDMAILDFIMPDMSGLDLLAQLRSGPLTDNLPVLFCTSVSDRNNVRRALTYKISGYVLKPIVARDFLTKVAAMEESVVPVLDTPRQTMSRLGISQKEFQELVTIMLDESQRRLQEIKQNLEPGEYQPFIRFTHDLSSSAGHFGAKALQLTADNIAGRARDLNRKNMEHFAFSLSSQMGWLREFTASGKFL